MATDPNEHPARRVPEGLPLPPGDQPPSTEQRLFHRSHSSRNRWGQTTLVKLRMKEQIQWASRQGCEL